MSAQIAERPDAPGTYLALAPMDGVTDGSYREVLTALFGGRSGISVCVSEFVRVLHQEVPTGVLLRHCPELARDGRTRAGVPVFVQLLGGEPRWMAVAAARAAQLGALGIDINFGCPAKTVNNSDGGATLLKTPCRVEDVTRAVREAVPAGIPVTAKVRIGWDDASPIVEIAQAAERGGASWLTIHGRTRAQLYRPPVDWQAIGRAREAVAIPVVANGDLFGLDALAACHTVSGCTAFMIGRGAMGRPELFAHARGWVSEPLSRVAMMELLQRYVAQLLDDGASHQNALGRLKQWLRMGGLLREDLATLFESLKRIQTLSEALQRLAQGADEQLNPSSRKSSVPSICTNALPSALP